MAASLGVSCQFIGSSAREAVKIEPVRAKNLHC
jgi:hypothetical protein